MSGLTVRVWDSKVLLLRLPPLWVPSEDVEVCHTTGHSHFWLSLTSWVTAFPWQAQPHDLVVGTHLGPLGSWTSQEQSQGQAEGKHT